jgi:aspartate aminotransferase
MVLSQLAQTLIGSEIVKLAGEIREKISQGEQIYNFTVGDFDPNIFPIPAELKNEIIAAYTNNFTNYPAAEGNLDLREAIAHYLQQFNNLNYGVNEILVASGGRPLIYSFFRTVADKGDKIIYAVPSWNNNHYTHFVEGEHIVIEATAENNFMPTAADIQPFIHDAVVLALCSPQNPTGTTFTKQALQEICDLVVAENQRRGDREKKLYVMYDQMYCQLTYNDVQHYDPVNLNPAMKEYTLYIDAISKAFAATGVRVGWSTGPATVIAKMKAILTHLGAWAPMAEQKACAKYLIQTEAIQTYLINFKAAIDYRLKTIYDGFKALQAEGFMVDAIAPQAAIYLTVKVDLVGKKTTTGDELETQADVTAYLLNDAKIALVPFYAFGAPSNSPWYRLSVGTCKKEEIATMLNGLKQSLKSLQ